MKTGTRHFAHTTWSQIRVGALVVVPLLQALALVRYWGSWGPILAIACAVAAAFAVRRIPSTTTEVDLGEASLVVRCWGKTQSTAFSEIRRVHFLDFPFDLLIQTERMEQIRIPRTIQGFQKIHDRVLEAVGDTEEVLPLRFATLTSYRVIGGILALSFLWAFTVIIGTGAPFPLLVASLGLLGAAFICVDRMILTRYELRADGLEVLRPSGRRFYPAGDLRVATVRKHAVTSAMRLHFNSTFVDIEDRCVEAPVQRVARIIERYWNKPVTGAKRLSWFAIDLTETRP